MILTVIVLSSTLLSVTLIGGFIMLYQIRHAGDFVNTTKAIFAADTGVDWWIYKESGSSITSSSINSSFSNQASFEVIPQSNGDAKIIGQAGNAKRAFLYHRAAGASACAPDVMLVIDADNRPDPQRRTYESQLKIFINELSSSTYGQAYIGIAVNFGNTARLAQGLTNNTSTLRSSITPLTYFDQFNLNDALGISQTELVSIRGRDDSLHPNYIIVTTDEYPDRPSANPKTAATDASNAIKTAGTTIIVASIDDAFPNGSAWHNYYASIASPGHYVSSTDPGAYDGSFNQILQKVNDNWISICQ